MRVGGWVLKKSGGKWKICAGGMEVIEKTSDTKRNRTGTVFGRSFVKWGDAGRGLWVDRILGLPPACVRVCVYVCMCVLDSGVALGVELEGVGG